MGFDENNIRQYIEADFEQDPEKACSLIELLESNPLIQSVCSVPLSCAIICYLWHNSQQALPSTITELYFVITLSVVLRDIKKKFPQCSMKSLQNFDSIPEELQKEFWLVCKFAFKFLSNDQIVFSDKQIASFLQDIHVQFNEKSFFFGLLQTAHSVLPWQTGSVGYGLSFHFIHLTIQEFLAALHIVTLSHEEKEKIFTAYTRNSRFNVVWRFVLGLEGKGGKYSKRVVSLSDILVDQILFALMDQEILLCHCSLESQTKLVNMKVANKLQGKLGYYDFLTNYNRPQTAHDCVAILYVLQHTNPCCSIKLNLSGCINEKQLQQLTTILRFSNLKVKEFNLDNCKLTSECLITFFNEVSASFLLVREVSLNGNCMTCVPLIILSRNITKLCLSKNPLGQPGIKSLEKTVRAGSLVNICQLHLSSSLAEDTGVNSVILVTLLSALATHCPNLMDLDLSENNLGVPGPCAVGEAFVKLAANRKALQLNLRETNLDSEAATAFSDKVLATLDDDLSPLSCEIDLCVGKNPFGSSGLLAIFRMLSNGKCPVTSLSLYDTVNKDQITTYTLNDALILSSG